MEASSQRFIDSYGQRVRVAISESHHLIWVIDDVETGYASSSTGMSYHTNAIALAFRSN